MTARMKRAAYGALAAIVVALGLSTPASACTWGSTVTFTAGNTGTFSVEYGSAGEQSGSRCVSCVLTTFSWRDPAGVEHGVSDVQNPAFAFDQAGRLVAFFFSILYEPLPGLIREAWFSGYVGDIILAESLTRDPVWPGIVYIGTGLPYADVPYPNLPPIAHLGPDRTVPRHTNVVLDGSGSFDPDGNYPLGGAFWLASRPPMSNAFLESTGGLVRTLYNVDQPGDYVVQLFVQDCKFFWSTDSVDYVTITAVNAPPVAAAGDDQAVKVRNTVVHLDGSQSYDADGDAITYTWSIASKPAGSAAALSNPNIVNPVFTADVKGTYTIVLVVTDEFGAVSSPDEMKVSFANLAPVADAGGSQSVAIGDAVVLSGANSFDPNGDPLAYAWSVIAGPDGANTVLSSPTSVETSFVPSVAGNYVFGLVVNDGIVDSAAATVSVYVVTVQTAITQALADAGALINSLDPTGFKNKTMGKTLTNNLNAVVAMIAHGAYAGALNKLENDVASRVDGCAAGGVPDDNDWVMNCAAQGDILRLVTTTMQYLGRL